MGNLSQKKKTKPILKLGSFHCWSVRLFVYEAGVLTQPSSFQSCCQLTDLTGIICKGMLDFFQIFSLPLLLYHQPVYHAL